MICLVCQADYQRMSGVQRFRKDYGYCSLDCLQASKSPCPACQAPIIRREGEPANEFADRTYCSQTCAASHATLGPKSPETRARMSEAARNISPEKRSKLSIARLAWLKTPEGRDGKAKALAAAQRWRSENEAEFQAKRRATLDARGWNREVSLKMKAFYQTPDGIRHRALLSQQRRGVTRPIRVTEAMRLSLRKFWDSPAGQIERDRISIALTKGLDRSPFGPGWSKQAARIRSRDKYCQICSAPRGKIGQQLDVHHIYSRRMFGYRPGQNQNYRWANHPANLIALCDSCHIRVERKAASVPESYQKRADALWNEFLSERAT